MKFNRQTANKQIVTAEEVSLYARNPKAWRDLYIHGRTTEKHQASDEPRLDAALLLAQYKSLQYRAYGRNTVIIACLAWLCLKSFQE
jgi:hypothetical protein